LIKKDPVSDRTAVPLQDEGRQGLGVIRALRYCALRLAAARAGKLLRKQGFAEERNPSEQSTATPEF